MVAVTSLSNGVANGGEEVTTSPAQWPPRSPHDVLAATPDGRERLRRMELRASLTPSRMTKSPSRPTTATATNARLHDRRGGGVEVDLDDDDDDDDEETLKLKLRAIEAKLKLKALQKKAAKGGAGADSNTTRPCSAPIPDVLAASRAQSRAEALRPCPRMRSRSRTEIEVPASPVKKAVAAPLPISPRRVVLGIDKGLRASHVSLKPVPIAKRAQDRQDGTAGGYLRRASTPGQGSSSSQQRPKSFLQRLVAARSEETARTEKEVKITKMRSKTFEIDHREVEQYKSRATDLPDVAAEPDTFSREEILLGRRIPRSKTMPTLKAGSQDSEPTAAGSVADAEADRTAKTSTPDVAEGEAGAFEPFSSIHLSKRILPHSFIARTLAGKKAYLVKDVLAQVKAPDFGLPDVEQDVVVMGVLASKSEPRSHKSADNSNLREKKGAADEEEQRGKYMVLTIVDLQWELELFLFGTAFNRYWKLVPGTLVAILNPSILPPPRGREATGRFSLMLNSDGDSVLEIGVARDLGFCKSVKRDGKLCESWINKKRTDFCEFHTNLALDRHRAARQELNTVAGLGPRKKSSVRDRFQSRTSSASSARTKTTGGSYDRDTHSHWFVSHGASTATLLDGQVPGRSERADALRRRLLHEEKERAIMKQLSKCGSGAGRDYMRRTEQGSALPAGGESTAAAAATAVGAGDPGRSSQAPPAVDAKSLGLLAARGEAHKIQLGPLRRKRDHGAFAATSSCSRAGMLVGADDGGEDSKKKKKKTKTDDRKEAESRAGTSLGWGGSLQDKLARMRGGERLDGRIVSVAAATAAATATADADARARAPAVAQEEGERDGAGPIGQPARKKTRFVTDRGIREAGRDSLGGERAPTGPLSARGPGAGRGLALLVDSDGDDDELVVLPR